MINPDLNMEDEIKGEKRLKPWFDRNLELLPGEIFKDIINFDGRYCVSNYGRVLSLKRYTDHGHIVTEKILKQNISKTNVTTVKLSCNQIVETHDILNLVGTAFLGDKKNDEHYCHLNKIKYDNRLKNIAIKTISETRLLDYKIGVNQDNGVVGAYSKQKRIDRENKFNVYDTEGILVAKICQSCMVEKTIDKFRFRNDNGRHRHDCAECQDKHNGTINLGSLNNARELAKSGLRKCSKCQTIKSLDTDFNNNKNCYMGKDNICRPCMKIVQDKAKQKRINKQITA